MKTGPGQRPDSSSQAAPDSPAHASRRARLGAAIDSLSPRQKLVLAVTGDTGDPVRAAERMGVHHSSLSAQLRAIAARLGIPAPSDLVPKAGGQMLDRSLQAIAVIDSDGTCVYANAGLAHLVGYSLDELRGRNFHAVVHARPDGGETPDRDCPILAVAEGRGLGHSGETLIWHRDGTPLWVSYTAVAAGEVDRRAMTVVVLRDLSGEVQAERELAASHARIEMVLDAAGMTAFEFDVDSGQFTAWGRLLDFEASTTLEDFVGQLRHPGGEALAAGALLGIPAGSTVDYELVLVAADGRERDVQARLRMASDGPGRSCRLAGVMVDVSATRDGARLHQAVIETAGDAFIGADLSGSVTNWNGAAERMFGYPRGQALGRQLEDLIIPSRYRQAHREALSRLAGGRPPPPAPRGSGAARGRRAARPDGEPGAAGAVGTGLSG